MLTESRDQWGNPDHFLKLYQKLTLQKNVAATPGLQGESTAAQQQLQSGVSIYDIHPYSKQDSFGFKCSQFVSVLD